MKKLALLFSTILVFTATTLTAQQANTLYYMDRVLQSQFVNPSINPAHNVQCGGLIVPLFGQVPPSMYFNYSNNSFNYNHLIHKGKDQLKDSLVIDFPLFMDKLQKTTHIRTEMRFEYLNLSFRPKKNKAIFTISLADRIMFGMSLPYDFFEFAFHGNRPYMLEGKSHDLSKLNISATYFHELAVGFNFPVGNNFMIGGRAKFLLGVADFSTKIENLELTTDPDMYFITASTNMQIRKATNLLDIRRDADASGIESDFSGNSLKQALLSMANIGVGLDLGVNYRLTEKINLSFSATDIGFISWMQNAQVAKAQGEYTFEGVELGLITGEDGKPSFGIDTARYNFEHITDTIVELFEMDIANKSYTTWLPTNIFVGATYQLHEKIGFGALYRGEFYHGDYMQSITLSANSNINHWLSLHASWSWMNNNALNVGFGFSARAACFTWYMVTDDVIGMILPQRAKSLSIRMGCNMTFGHPKKVSKTQTRL